jgi:hypothetical protein
MSAKVHAVLSRHKFQPFCDVMTAEAAENQSLEHMTDKADHEQIVEHAQVAVHGRGNS